MASENSISIIVPAFNEEGNLEATINEVVAAVDSEFDEHEIIIIDDCSRDGTRAAADRIASENENVLVVHNETNMGLGWNYKAGVRMARMHYVMLVNGKHDIAAAELRKVFSARGQADVIVPYHTNAAKRSLWRRIVSRSFTTLLNILFGYRLHYYNDSTLHRTSVVRALKLRTNSYAFTAEALIKSLKSGCGYVEVPIQNIYPKGIKTNAFTARNVRQVASFLWWMIYDIYIGRNYRREQ